MIDLSTKLRGLDGEQLMEQVVEAAGPRVVPMTLGRVCAAALIQPFAQDQQLDGVVKLQRFVLAQRVVLGGEIALKPAEIEDIKLVVGRMYGPLIVGRVFEQLDANPAKPPRRSRK